jgi:ABC-type multidrug transport system fused ATPase/permease subunit
MMIPIYRSWFGEDYQGALPLMALFAYAGYRILPSAQQLYTSFSILRFYDTLAIRFVDVLCAHSGKDVVERTHRISKLVGGIRLIHVSYCYPEKATPAITGVNLTINRHEKVAIIGPSGAGKSTLLDILLGLLRPTTGEVVVNDESVSASGISWDSQSIGYVPQSPLLVSETIAQNIAFGVSEESIDRQRCKSLAEFACLDDVIEGLPHGYDTLLAGGVSLSGGEIQRLAIARALYFAPDILVLDEPSSALDPIISSRLFGNLCSSAFECTVVAVTHDWDVLEGFDKIIVVDNAEVVAVGDLPTVREHIDILRGATTPAPMHPVLTS